MARQDPTRRSVARRGRQIGLIAFGLLVSAFTGVCTVQIIQQVFFPRGVAGGWPHECFPSVVELHRTVAAARRNLLLTGDDEFAAVAAFRKALQPGWAHRSDLDAVCLSVADKSLLALVDDFRYAQEHFVRLEAARLADTQQTLASVLHQSTSSIGYETKTETDK
jgi:hypothetical protein